MSLDYLKCTEWHLACKMLHKCPLTQNVTLKNAYSKRVFVSCPGQFRARAGNESSVGTPPLGVRHESKTVLARQKHWEC